MENETLSPASYSIKYFLLEGCTELEIVAKTIMELHDGSEEGQILSLAVQALRNLKWTGGTGIVD